MSKFRRFSHKQRRPIRIFMVLILGGALLFMLVTGRLPGTIWLPASSQQHSDRDILFDSPVKSNMVLTKYGWAVKYSSANVGPTESEATPWTRIYEFRANPLLKASACPNIVNVESLLPSDCKKLGTFQGQPVYGLSRSLPSGLSEHFVKVGSTFIYIQRGGDGLQQPTYVQSFKALPRQQITPYLQANSKKVQQVHAKEEATQRNNRLAYTRLDFTPALPQALPAGWQLQKGALPSVPFEIDGPDAKHPKVVNMTYRNSKSEAVYVQVGKLSDFKLGTLCGPTPKNHSLQDVECHKRPDASYYEANFYESTGTLFRYVYYPVGDSVVISNIFVSPEGNKFPAWPTDLAKIQEAITLSAQPVDKNSLKDSVYHPANL